MCVTCVCVVFLCVCMAQLLLCVYMRLSMLLLVCVYVCVERYTESGYLSPLQKDAQHDGDEKGKMEEDAWWMEQ